VLQRALTLHVVGLPRQKDLADADAVLTPEWFGVLLEAATAAQALPGLDLRLADQHQTVLSRDEALAQARPLLQDLFFYAKKAYPTTPHADDLFGHRAVTAAGSNAALLNAALQVAAQQTTARTMALQTGGMPSAKIKRLVELAVLAGQGTTDVLAEHGEATVVTANYTGVFNALWRLLSTLHEAAQVAYRQDDKQLALFRLTEAGPEERSPAAPTRKVVRLDSELRPDRLLSVTVDAPAGPVRVALLLLPDDAPTPGLMLETTPPRHPRQVLAADLGPEGAQYLLLENDRDQKASVRVLPVGG
jgi:hypothetical protein